MNTQLKKLGLGLVLAILPLMAASASAQWTPQGVATAAPAIDAKPINTITVSQDGTLLGQIANGQEGLNVFFVRDGQVVRQAQTGSDGSFTVQGLTEGPYSFFAAGKSDFAAYGVYVTGQDNGYSPNVLEVATASPSYTGIQRLIQSDVPSQIRNQVANPSRNPATQGVTQVRLINGRLSGQINSLYGSHQLSTGVQVQLIQNDRPIAQVQTNAKGQFSIPDVAPGVYDFVAASQNGFTASRFEAVGNSPMTQVSFRKTATLVTACLTTPGTNANPNMNSYDDQPVDYAIEPSYQESVELAGESAVYGGANGGSGGNLGRLGGGARGGRLHGGGGMGKGFILGAAGLGVGITALATDNKHKKVPPASPYLPY